MIAIKPAATISGAIEWAVPPPPANDSGSQRALEIVVIFTAVKQTLEALRTASSLAESLHAAIRVVVAQFVPYPLPLERPPIGRDFTERRFRTLLPSGSIPTWVDVRLCRDESAILNALAPNSVVVIGISTRWWPESGRRLARLLRAEGHHVITAGHKRGRHA